MENYQAHAAMAHSSSTLRSSHDPDVVLIGAGIMSATLAVILKELMPR